MNIDDYKLELRRQLLDAASRPHNVPRAAHRPSPRPSRSTRGVRLAVAACLVTIAAAVGIFALESDRASASVQVIVDDGYISVLLTDARSRPDEIEAAAREHGLDIQVLTEPVGPTDVGRFVRTAMTDLPPDARVQDASDGSFAGFRLPVDWTGTLQVSLGRRAEPGELWAMASNALAPGGPAACLDVLGEPLEQVVDRLGRREMSVRPFVLDPGEIELSPNDLGAYAGWPVTEVEADSADRVEVRATVDGRVPVTGERPTLPPGC